jgi:hypothetical protein
MVMVDAIVHHGMSTQPDGAWSGLSEQLLIALSQALATGVRLLSQQGFEPVDPIWDDLQDERW